FVVHTRAEQVLGQTDAYGDCRTVRMHAIRARGDQARVGRAIHAAVAEIDIEIFDLGRPIIGERPLDTAAGSPAGLSVGRLNAVKGSLYVGKRAAPREIEQDAIRGITGAAAHSRQPIVAGLALAAERTNAGCGAGIDCGIVPIAFDAEHKCAGLEIHTQRTADHAAIIAASAGCSWEAWHRLRNGVEATTADGICREFGIA